MKAVTRLVESILNEGSPLDLWKRGSGKWVIPIGRQAEAIPHLPAPDRTSTESLPGVFGDDLFKQWPNREAMAKAMRKEQRNTGNPKMRAVVPLKDGEGY